jgi:hypothetical protein
VRKGVLTLSTFAFSTILPELEIMILLPIKVLLEFVPPFAMLTGADRLMIGTEAVPVILIPVPAVMLVTPELGIACQVGAELAPVLVST